MVNSHLISKSYSGALQATLFFLLLEAGQELTFRAKVLMQGHQAKRKGLRVPVSFLVRGQQADNSEFGGKSTDLSAGGIAFNTNSPIKIGEQLSIEFPVPDTLNPVNVSGEVVWSQFHESAGSLFRAGIRFLKAGSNPPSLILDYLLKLVWREYLLGKQEVERLLSDIENLPAQEKRIIFHNYYFCSPFVEGRCPSQIIMERAYLISQFMNVDDLVECQNTCWTCEVYRQRQIY